MLPTTSIIRQSTRRPDEPYNILTAITHERYESQLCRTGHSFYAFGHESFKPYWNENFVAIPDNYYVMRPNKLPSHIKFDFVLSHNKFGQYQILAPLAKKLHLPLVSVEHTLPFPGWTPEVVENCGRMRGNINAFISKYSIGHWGWEERNDTHVVRHGIDTDKFTDGTQGRANHLLSVVNDWRNRDWACGYRLWQHVSNGLPVKVIGDTKGLSLPSKSIDDLINTYQTSKIFLNTSLVSPVPMSLMEAMSCGCAVVSTATCAIPEIIEHGVNGFMSNNPDELRKYCELLLSDDDLSEKIGQAARQTIIDKFGLDSFVNKWNTLFDIAANTAYLG